MWPTDASTAARGPDATENSSPRKRCDRLRLGRRLDDDEGSGHRRKVERTDRGLVNALGSLRPPPPSEGEKVPGDLRLPVGNHIPGATPLYAAAMSGTADTDPQFDRRPWGTFQVLDDRERYKVKRITVDPGQRLSYQKHARRSRALGGRDGLRPGHPRRRSTTSSTRGESIDIPLGAAHRVEQPRRRRARLRRSADGRLLRGG